MGIRPPVIRLFVFVRLLVAGVQSASAQPPSAEKAYLSREGLNRLLNLIFGGIDDEALH